MQVSGGDGVVEWREAEYRGSEKLVSQLWMGGRGYNIVNGAGCRV